jgi:sterol desaturase/sphingolipid hydroxylase (fatty acid hydroxylase superfamily)
MIPLQGYMSSRTAYYALLAVDCVGGLLAVAAGFALGARLVVGLVAVAIAALWYSFGEYAIHRWFYHHGRSLLSAVHAFHHREPEQLLGAPFYSVVIAALHGLAAGVLAGAPLGLVFGGAVLFSHGQQGVIHHAAHGYRHLGVLGRRSALRRHHALHHVVGTANFGISTTLWDRVLGTHVTTNARRTRVASCSTSQSATALGAPLTNA